MGETKNLTDKKAIDKLRELTEGKTTMFCTYTGEYRIQARPMSTNKVDEQGNIWFLSDAQSRQNEQLQAHKYVDLLYANSDQSYCTVKGAAEILRDQAIIDELWNPVAKAWFTEGKTDPRISVIRVTPSEAHYWDTKSGKFIAFLKIAAAAITGNHAEEGVEGDLNV